MIDRGQLGSFSCWSPTTTTSLHGGEKTIKREEMRGERGKRGKEEEKKGQKADPAHTLILKSFPPCFLRVH